MLSAAFSRDSGRSAGAGSAWKAEATLQTVRVAAASDLKFVLAELAQQYPGPTGRRIELTPGSIGQFARQNPGRPSG